MSAHSDMALVITPKKASTIKNSLVGAMSGPAQMLLGCHGGNDQDILNQFCKLCDAPMLASAANCLLRLIVPIMSVSQHPMICVNPIFADSNPTCSTHCVAQAKVGAIPSARMQGDGCCSTRTGCSLESWRHFALPASTCANPSCRSYEEPHCAVTATVVRCSLKMSSGASWCRGHSYQARRGGIHNDTQGR